MILLVFCLLPLAACGGGSGSERHLPVLRAESADLQSAHIVLFAGGEAVEFVVVLSDVGTSGTEGIQHESGKPRGEGSIALCHARD